ncbi:MAG: phasin family protein [bacterium]
MFEKLKKTLDEGIDFAFATTEKITKAAKEMAKENNLTKEEARKLMDHLMKKADEARANMGKTMQDFLKTSLKKMNIPTKEDVRKLEERITKLEGEAKKPATPVRRKVVSK